MFKNKTNSIMKNLSKISTVILLAICLSSNTADSYTTTLSSEQLTTYTVCRWNSSEKILIKNQPISLGQTFNSKADITFSRANQEVLATYGRESAPSARLFKYRCTPAGRCSIYDRQVAAPDQKECPGYRR
jgi:hypothetical protein